MTIDVDTNDTGEPDVASYAVVAGPDHGVLGAFDPTTAEIVYTPTSGYVGEDSFTYSVDEIPGVPFDESGLTTGAGGLAAGAADPDWTTSDTLGRARFAATGHPAPDVAWAADPFAAGGSICSQACDDTGLLFFHRSFQIVDQATADGLAVALDLYAPDTLTEVYVNGAAASISSTGDTSCGGCGLSIMLRSSDPAFSFVVGTNTISVAISGNGDGPIGLLVTPGTGDDDGRTVWPTTPTAASLPRRPRCTATDVGAKSPPCRSWCSILRIFRAGSAANRSTVRSRTR